LIVSNATPLIYLAKMDKLNLLVELFEAIQIAPEVKKECVDRGKQRHYGDAEIIDRYIREGKIKIHSLSTKTLKKSEELADLFQIDKGEAQSIILAKEKEETQILIDQTHARKAAKFMGLTPRGTLYVLLKLVDRNIISKNEAIKLLNDLINSNFFVSVRIYQKVLEALS